MSVDTVTPPTPTPLHPDRLAPHLPDFEAFCARQPSRDGRFFMFFTSGLLHWVRQASSFVPRGVDLALIGAGLTDDEVRWAHDSLDRPFHHIERRVDDKTVWELLFATQNRHFGWLDVDCFVLDPRLFDDLRALRPEHFANTVWSYRGPEDRWVLRTYLLYLNALAVDTVPRAIPVTPSVYSFDESRRGRTEPGATTETVTPEIERLLRRALGRGSDGHPPYLTQPDFYDTLQVYQLAAESLGYRLHRVRELSGYDNTEEVVHLGRVSYYNWAWGGVALPENRKAFQVIAQADYLVLSQAADRLPPRYRERLDHLRHELPRIGLPTDIRRLESIMIRALAEEGIGQESARRMLAPV